jgi:hypothetical protein
VNIPTITDVENRCYQVRTTLVRLLRAGLLRVLPHPRWADCDPPPTGVRRWLDTFGWWRRGIEITRYREHS